MDCWAGESDLGPRLDQAPFHFNLMEVEMPTYKKEIVYSTQTSNFLKGRSYSNPRHFSTPRDGFEKVYVVGNWPEVVAAYSDIGVPVQVIDELDYFGDPDLASKNIQVAHDPFAEPKRNMADLATIEIPENWREMQWVGLD